MQSGGGTVQARPRVLMERLRPESSRSGLGLDRPVAWAHGAQTRPGGGRRGGAGALDAPLGRDGGALALCRLLVGLEAAVPRDRGGRAARRLQRRVAAGRVGAQHLQSRGDAARWSASARPPQPWSESGTVPPPPLSALHPSPLLSQKSPMGLHLRPASHGLGSRGLGGAVGLLQDGSGGRGGWDGYGMGCAEGCRARAVCAPSSPGTPCEWSRSGAPCSRRAWPSDPSSASRALQSPWAQPQSGSTHRWLGSAVQVYRMVRADRACFWISPSFCERLRLWHRELPSRSVLHQNANISVVDCSAEERGRPPSGRAPRSWPAAVVRHRARSEARSIEGPYPHVDGVRDAPPPDGLVNV